MNLMELPFIEKLLTDLVALIALVWSGQQRQSLKQNVAGSMVLFGMGVFLVTYLLHSIEMSMGFVFGLFAIFSMLRYRTESMTVQDMTYLFLAISLSLIIAVSNLSLLENALIAAFVCLATWMVDSLWNRQSRPAKTVRYDRIDWIQPQYRQHLLDDLRRRTGLPIVDVEIESVDFLRDSALLNVHCQTAKRAAPSHVRRKVFS
ncbi:DUF4956 domain-containing protein [Marinobacteraceae bacterium S3BR75-40.1]